MKRSSLLRTTGLIIFALLGLSLAACNTMEGVGEDVGEAGEAIEDAAD